MISQEENREGLSVFPECNVDNKILLDKAISVISWGKVSLFDFSYTIEGEERKAFSFSFFTQKEKSKRIQAATNHLVKISIELSFGGAKAERIHLSLRALDGVIGCHCCIFFSKDSHSDIAILSKFFLFFPFHIDSGLLSY